MAGGRHGAIVMRRPGRAILWMWVSAALLGMATIYAEAVLAQRYRTTVTQRQSHRRPGVLHPRGVQGHLWQGAGAAYSRYLLFWRWASWATWYSPTPSVMPFHNAFGMSHLAVGIVVAVIAAFIFLGGVQRIACCDRKDRAHHGGVFYHCRLRW